MERTSSLGAAFEDGGVVRADIQTTLRIIPHIKARQSAKLRELRQALVDAGVVSLDHQAAAPECLGARPGWF